MLPALDVNTTLAPEHIAVDPPAVMVGVAGNALTVIAALDVVAVHAPFVTNALKYVVAVRFVAKYVEAIALLILVNAVLFVELCHWIVPLLPLSVRVTLLVPVHTEDTLLLTVPATGPGLTIIVPVAFTVPQPPNNGIL